METKASRVLKEKFDIDINELSKRAQIGLNDVEENHNLNWVRDLYEKNKNNLDDIAIFYRGTKVSYRELFQKALKYASAFEKKGLKEGMEVPMCMSNCPEFLYSIMGINLLGAKMNCFGTFDNEYLKEIISDTDAPFLICTDDKYEIIKDALDVSNKDEIVMVSLTDSLINGEDPYIDVDREFYDFKNRVGEYKQTDSRISSIDEFLQMADSSIDKKIEDYNNGNLDTEFLVTYSSGSTNSKRPKAMKHSNRSLITMGRFEEADLSDLPVIRGLIGEAMIPTHSNTGVITGMSDVLYKGCTVALEPIYHKDFLLPSLAINKPNYITAPTNMLVDGAKKIYSDIRYTDFKMPYMMMFTAVGEPTTMGEEKFINKMLRKAKAGSSKLPMPVSPVPLSIGGGDCERGGMFFTPFRKYQDLHPKYKLFNGRCGLKKYDMVQLAVLDDRGEVLPLGSTGRLVAKTPTRMVGYKNNPVATKEFYIKDSSGRTWTDCNVYATIEKHGTVDILERIGKEIILDDGTKVPLFMAGKEIEKDTKNILSYEMANVDNVIVAHVEMQPNSKKDIASVLYSADRRIAKENGEEIANKVVYRVRSFEEGFPRTACEKKNNPALVEEGITEQCVKPIMDSDGKIKLVSAGEYLTDTEPKKLIRKVTS